MCIYKDENFRTIKNANTTNHEGIHKKLCELPDRRMKIKNIRSSLPLVRDRDNFLLQQENFWLSSKFTLWKYIVQIFISFWFLFQASYKDSIKILTMLCYCIVNKVTHLLPKLWTVEKLINNFQYHTVKLHLCTNLMILFKGNVTYRPWKFDILFGVILYPVTLRHRWVLFCVITL